MKKNEAVKKCCDLNSPLSVPDGAASFLYSRKVISEILGKKEEECSICSVHGYDPYCPNCGTRVED